MVINRKEMARAKLKQLKNGFSAFAETSEVAEIIEKELAKLDLNIHVDRTPMGSWFIPVTDHE
jgi:putative aminopeptidase FrvX